MLSIIKSIALDGLDGYIINVQVDVSAGMPEWTIVGLPDASIRESKERVRTAIKNTSIELLSRKVIINLAPANIRKEGSFLDLPIAIGILSSINYIPKLNLNDMAFVGELSLSGNINPIKGILPICIEAKKIGIKRIIIPYENLREASIVEGLIIKGAKNLKEIINFLTNGEDLYQLQSKYEKLIQQNEEYELDFADVKGQEDVKRAVEVSASGGHNLLMQGNPGGGKTLIAKRIPSILPKLSFEEALEVTKIHSIAGTLDKLNPIVTKRPFRNPHHNITKSALIGGGRIPKPGEISLAHLGVLFLDELAEFNKEILELLRIPLEDGKISISRMNSNITYPSKCMLVAAMNPCPCGYYGSNIKECTCTPQAIDKYINKVSGPLLDRIDIQIHVQNIKYEKLQNDKPESSKIIRERVTKARNIQLRRYKNDNIYFNASLTPKLIEKYCKIDNESKKILELAFNKLGLSARAYMKILKVARTIADLEEKDNIKKEHILEAIGYRKLDRR